ncbi:hypothetical protein [Mycobacterium sp. NPDC050853]|uniref:hypothetical protein n=1 Tax=Mycobacterium sp. NPDC050853 TaxID=3155160 RepID=UPI0033FFB992
MTQPGRSIDQPLVGFNYGYWFACVNCGNRIDICSTDFKQQCTAEAPFTVCECGTEVDITERSPTLRNPNDVALQEELVGGLWWYHSSRYERWPDIEAYAADVREMVTQIRFDFVDPERVFRKKTTLALHLGTYEAAIENMLRRMHDQDVGDRGTTQYWLHRVSLCLEPGDLDPHVGAEFATLMGDVELSELHSQGARAVRYINVHEAVGSVSVAVDPDVIGEVATIPILDEACAVEASITATEAADSATTALAEIEKLRPDTTGIADSSLRVAGLRPQPKDPDDPISVRIHALARQLAIYEHRRQEIWTELTDIFEREYLPDINERVRDRFHGAVVRGEYPVDYHQRFRVMAGLLTQPGRVIGRFTSG